MQSLIDWWKTWRFRPQTGDDVELEDSSRHSLKHCCDPPDHSWPHPSAGEWAHDGG